MVTVSTENPLVTLINVFSVKPENQQKVADILVEATNKTMKDLPGFISASIHKSFDGERVTNYVQWRSQADHEAMMKDPKAQEHMKPLYELADVDPHFYEVIESVSA